MKQTQAERVIKKFGGVHELADAFAKHKINRSKSTIYRWSYPYGVNGGTGGLIPLAAMQDILWLAEQEGVKLTSEDLDPRER